MPLKFWDEAFSTAVFLINRLPSKVINNETPYERLLQQTPDYSFLRTFGCACWPNLRPFNNKKLSLRSKQCVFLGYSNLHNGFKCLDPSVGRVYISRDVVFDEQVYPFSLLHPNAGALLRSELSILPDVLLNPSSQFGDATLLDRNVDTPLSNRGPSTTSVDENAGENGVQIDANSDENGRYFMHPLPNNGGAETQVDPPAEDSAPAAPGTISSPGSGLVSSDEPVSRYSGPDAGSSAASSTPLQSTTTPSSPQLDPSAGR
jgi:hypothetical protein